VFPLVVFQLDEEQQRFLDEGIDFDVVLGTRNPDFVMQRMVDIQGRAAAS
jgi:hypothetical protein